jgi:hypothetical protein
MFKKKGLVVFIKNIDFSYHFNLFLRCFIPTFSLVMGLVFMLIIFPTSATDIFMFDLSYAVFIAKILTIIFFYSLGTFVIREIVPIQR